MYMYNLIVRTECLLIWIYKKHNKPTRSQKAINPSKMDSFIDGNWVPTQFQRSAYSFPTECLPNFRKVPTLFSKSL